MKRNIIKELMDGISSKFISNTAQAFEESESGIGEGMKNLVPTIFYQLHHKMNGEEAKDFFQFLKNENNTAIANQLNGLNPNEASVLERKNIVNDFAKKLFGNQRAGIEGFISQKNELRPDSSKALMTVANTLVIGHFSKLISCLLYTSPSPRDQRGSRMPSSA